MCFQMFKSRCLWTCVATDIENGKDKVNVCWCLLMDSGRNYCSGPLLRDFCLCLFHLLGIPKFQSQAEGSLSRNLLFELLALDTVYSIASTSLGQPLLSVVSISKWHLDAATEDLHLLWPYLHVQKRLLFFFAVCNICCLSQLRNLNQPAKGFIRVSCTGALHSNITISFVMCLVSNLRVWSLNWVAIDDGFLVVE